MPIIRITQKLIQQANKARDTAFQKDPEFRVHEERQRLRRESASSGNAEQINTANEIQRAAPTAVSDCAQAESQRVVERAKEQPQ